MQLVSQEFYVLKLKNELLGLGGSPRVSVYTLPYRHLIAYKLRQALIPHPIHLYFGCNLLVLYEW